MQITFLGTGSAMPTGHRYQAGILVQEGENTLLVDCGSGVLHRLQQAGVGYENVSQVLLTHHHLDHVADLLVLVKARWLAGEEYLELVGPRGTKALVDGLFEVHDYMRGRIDLAVREVDANPFSVAGFAVDAIETRHSMPCLAYRFTGETGDFTFSADTEAFEGLATFADGSAVLAHDCSFPDDVDVSNHPTPAQLGSALAGCDVGRVYLTHLYPHTEGRHEEMRRSIREEFDGEVVVAEDLLEVEC